MADEKNILLVTNSTTEGEILLIKEAFSQANEKGMNLKLNLVHVIPNLPTCYFSIPSMVILAERYYEEAALSLTMIGQLLNVAKSDQWLISGKIKIEVLRLADRLDAHFILANSASLRELHKSFFFLRKEPKSKPIRSISSLVTI